MREDLTVATTGDMLALGRRLASVLLPGDLVVLSGDLGAGKTTLVQGIGAGLGVRGPITSPTFVIARVHPSLSGGPALVHVDAYRLDSPAEVDDLDLDASLETSVTVVEWGGGLVEDLAPDRLDVGIALASPPPAPGRACPAGPRPGARPGRSRSHGRYGWRATAPGGKASASRLPAVRLPRAARPRRAARRPPVAGRLADLSTLARTCHGFWPEKPGAERT